MIAIIDYGAGNIFSVKNALDYLGFENKLTDKKEDIEKIDSLDILASSNDAGVYLVAEKDGSRFFVTGHPEYDPDTLDKE